VEELAAEALRRLFLKPGTDHYSRFVEELTKGGKLALRFDRETGSSYVFRLFRIEEGSGLVDLGIELWIEKVGKGIIYFLKFDDVERWQEIFKPELEAEMKAAAEVGRRLPIEDLFPYMLGWVNSDVAVTRNKDARMLEMTTSHLWQLAETHALFGWSYVTVSGVSLTLEGPKPQFYAYTSLQRLDEAIKKSAESGWLKMLDIKARSWDGLKQWVSDHWDEVINAVKKQLKDVKVGSGFDLAGALEELEALRDRLNDDKVAREVVAPALLLIQAERLGVNETTLKYLGAVTSGAIGGDGYVSAAMKEVELASGERGIALLWGAAFTAHGIKAEVKRIWSAFQVVASGGDAARLAALYFLYGPPMLEENERIINYKLAEAVELGAEGLGVSWEGLRKTPNGLVAADLIISVGAAAVKYNVYLREKAVMLQFQSTDRSRAELAAHLLKLAGVGAEVKKMNNRDEWQVWATTDKLAAARKELRDTLAKIVETARSNGWVDEEKAKHWLDKLKRGRTVREGWPKYLIGLDHHGALLVRFASTSLDSIRREAQRLEKMGLEEGEHFSVKMPEGGGVGYISIRRKGLEHAARLSEHGSGEQQRLAAEFVEYILWRAWETGEEVYEKVKEIIEEGRARGSLRLAGFEKEVEVGGRRHVVKVIGGSAEFEKSESGKLLLRIKITAEVDGVLRDYTITYSRYGADNKAMGFAYASAKAPGGREADAERLAAVIEALTGVKPRMRRRSGGKIEIVCGMEHLDGFVRFAELADTVERWLKETGR
jgi:hypothetical protein